MKIIHISDLHFCTPELKQILGIITDSIKKQFSYDLEIDYHDNEIAQVLQRLIQKVDPDIILITGDITTFGDEQSFALAYEWIRPLLARSNGKAERECVILPGNHDVLQGQFAYLLQKMPFYWRGVVKLRYWEIYKQIKNVVGEIKINSPSDIFTNFNRFAKSNHGLFSDRLEKNIDDEQKLIIHPFQSVSTNPIWMNLGECYKQELDRLNGSLLETQDRKGGELHILALHHNPISSAEVSEPAIANAYNSMPSGVQLLKVLQQKGVDLVLHGHQHARAIAMFDLDLETAGHAYGIGVSSSTTSTNTGCNLLTIEDVNNVKLTTFQYQKGQHNFVKEKEWELCLERNRPKQTKASTVRFEIKRYISEPEDGNEGELWNEMMLPGSKLVYISGRRLNTMTTTAYLTQLEKLLSKIKAENQPGSYVRILISDPILLRKFAKPMGKIGKVTIQRENQAIIKADGLRSPWVWGRKEDLEELAGDAGRSIDRLEKFVNDLSSEQRRRVDVRISHTLLPFAATVRDADKLWGKMVVRLLPVGAIGDLSSPVMKLHRRKAKALYDHYFTHLKYLIGQGVSVFGEWDKGEDDLYLGEQLPPPKPSLKKNE